LNKRDKEIIRKLTTYYDQIAKPNQTLAESYLKGHILLKLIEMLKEKSIKQYKKTASLYADIVSFSMNGNLLYHKTNLEKLELGAVKAQLESDILYMQFSIKLKQMEENDLSLDSKSNIDKTNPIDPKINNPMRRKFFDDAINEFLNPEK
jgi:hypothetical protein